MSVADIKIGWCKSQRDIKCRVLLTDFREGNQLAAGLSSFVDEVDSLLDTSLEIEPLWRVSDSDTGRL